MLQEIYILRLTKYQATKQQAKQKQQTKFDKQTDNKLTN